MSISIGAKIRQRLDEKGETVVWLARRLSCSRTNVYKIFEKQDLDTGLLLRISTVLEHDFFQYYSKEYRHLKAEGSSQGKAAK